MSKTAPNPEFVDVSTEEGIDFRAAVGTNSWERADPRAALIEPFARFGYRVMLPGGDVHLLAFAIENGEYTGRCDCQGYRYHDGPCAHLCTLRKADFGNLIDVHAVDKISDEHAMAQSDGEVMADGGEVCRR